MINVIGLGYIGLPTALMLAAHGNEVVGTDINSDVIDKLNAGEVTFQEDGLKDLFVMAVNSGITFSADYARASMYIVAVPTPYDKSTKKVDPHYVITSVETILSVCDSGAIIIIESTVSPGTVEQHIRPLISGKDVHLVHAPERIIPGNMLHELKNNSRIRR